jgi:hypothetical protein
MDSDITLLAERLKRVERQNGMLKAVGLITLCTGVLMIVMGQSRPSPRVVEAERFIVRDSKGDEKASLGLASDGAALTAGSEWSTL